MRTFRLAMVGRVGRRWLHCRLLVEGGKVTPGLGGWRGGYGIASEGACGAGRPQKTMVCPTRKQVWRPVLHGGITQESWELCVAVGVSLCWVCILGLGFTNAKFWGLR